MESNSIIRRFSDEKSESGIVQSVSNDEIMNCVRQVGLYLLQAFKHLRGVGLSKKLLLSAVMRIANSANNGGTL